MARSAATKTSTIKKSTTKGGTTKKAGSTLSQTDHESSAYFNWLNRGAPIGDDQRDWFDTSAS